jgi:hypothetical protein
MSWTGFTEDLTDAEHYEGPGIRKAKSSNKKPREKLLVAAASLKTSSVVGSSDSLPPEARLIQPQPATPVKMRVSGKYLGFLTTSSVVSKRGRFLVLWNL